VEVAAAARLHGVVVGEAFTARGVPHCDISTQQTRIGSKRIDFRIVFVDSVSQALQVIVGKVEEDIVTASKCRW
jgi:hypothetical protein